MRTSIIIAVCALTPATALAAQSRPVTDFNGTYELTCVAASIVLHLDLAGQVGETGDSVSEAVTFDLDCDGVDAGEEAAIASELEEACTTGGILDPFCADVATAIAGAVADANDSAVGVVPEEVTFKVQNTWNWWYRLWGAYPMTGTHTWADGSTATASYWINNNDFAPRGTFVAVSGQMVDSGAWDSLGCATAELAAVSGRIDPASSYALTAEAGSDASLYCLAVDGADWLLLVAGVTLTADVEGVRS